MMYPPAGLPKDMVEPTIGGSDYWANKVRVQYRKTNPEQVRTGRKTASYVDVSPWTTGLAVQEDAARLVGECFFAVALS